MKKLILFFIALFSVVLLNAQTKEQFYEQLYKQIHGGLSNEDFFNQSELVVEGRMLKIVDTYDAIGNGDEEDFYSILPIKVQRVYKGDQSLTGDIVYTVCKKNEIGAYFPCYPVKQEQKIFINGDDTIKITVDREEMYIGPAVLRQNGIDGGVGFDTPSIFFLGTSNFPDSKNPKYSSYKKYKFLYNEDSRLWVLKSDITGLITKILGLKNLVFNTREELYNYMKQFEGYIVPEPAPLSEKK